MLRSRPGPSPTTTPTWLLELDSGGSAKDHCWAMIDVLRVLSSGAEAAEFATASRRLRLVPDLPSEAPLSDSGRSPSPHTGWAHREGCRESALRGVGRTDGWFRGEATQIEQ